ncbi:MAG: hypothetical protein K0R48_1496, partial [Gammaproteobacteria bacterium]|nr:hypothetical protein [Gammaproteobacteria bacterium]
VTPTPKLWAIVFTDANTAEITEVAEVRSYFIVDDNGIPLGEPKNALEEAPAFLIITTTQRVSMVDRRLTVEYTHMTNEVKVSEERLCNAVGSLLSDEGLGLVDSNLMNKFHALAQGDASSSIKAFAKHITETMKYGYPSWQTPEDRNKTSEYLAELEKNLIKIQELEQAGFNDTAALYAVLCELVRCADGCDIHMNLSVSSSFYLKISDIISNLDASPYVKARALFIMILEHYYIGIQSSLNNYCQENLQTPDSIYTAGQQLFVAAGKAFESAPTEVTGYLTTVVKYATKQLQPLIEPTVKNSSVLPTTPQKCSDEEYQEAKTKLQAAGYDKVVSSATKFLEAVATAIVNRFLSTVVAIASLGPSLMPSCANLLFGSACGHGYINWTTGASFLAPNPSNRRPQAQSNSPAPAA